MKLLKIDNFLFDLSSKSGSNSVMSSILHGRRLKTASEKDPRSYWAHYNNNTVNKIIPGHISIKVVRNPYHRAISSFTHYSNVCELKDLSFVEWMRRVKKLSEIYYYSPTFYSDNEYRIKRLFPFINDRLFEHFYLQTNQGNLRFDHTIKLENYNHEIRKINKLYRVSFKPITCDQNVRYKKATFKNEDTNFAIAKFLEYATNLPPDYHRFLNNESIDLINKVYGEDVKNFGYPKLGKRYK